MRRPHRLVLAALLAVGVASPAAPARADRGLQSLLQDDDHLVYASPATVAGTLATLKAIGVQQLRVTMKWSDVAPAAGSPRRPAGFDATDPAAYPAGGWSRYDLLVLEAARYRIQIQLNLTVPGPLWAMRPGAPTARAADHWAPNADDFQSFVTAVGRRYGGAYAGLPRVSLWSIWNEPNQPGWLAPQWTSSGRRVVLSSARLYRSYVRAGYLGLRAAGHTTAHDTILIGELAPEGDRAHGSYTATTPIPFLRALYCLDSRYRPLRGRAAAAFGCPHAGHRNAFVKANPLLFHATGFGHHPYYFFHPPAFSSPDPNFVPLANLARLERALDRTYRTYGVRRRIPLYLTEYGYQTNPPDPYQVATPAQQAVYLNQAEYLAWHDPRVRALAQFLLYDAGPDARYSPSELGYWDTFQTGLLFGNGAPKPAFASYQMPIWVPARRVRRGRRLFVWGQARAASQAGAQRALLQWRPRQGGFRTIRTVTTRNASGFLTARVRIPRSGSIRIAWRSPSGAVLVSRSVAVRVG